MELTVYRSSPPLSPDTERASLPLRRHSDLLTEVGSISSDSYVDENEDTQSLILKGLGSRLEQLTDELNSKQGKLLLTLAKRCRELGENTPDGDKLHCTALRYQQLRQLKRALINAERKGDFPPNVGGQLQLMIETIRILQTQTCASWINMAIERVDKESRQATKDGVGRAGNTSSVVVAGGLRASIAIGIGKINVSLGLARKKTELFQDDTIISITKDRSVKVGLDLKGTIAAVTQAKVMAEGSGHHISTKDYLSNADATAALEVERIRTHLPPFMHSASLVRMPGFSRTQLVENLRQTANNAVPRLKELVRELGLPNDPASRISELDSVEGKKSIICRQGYGAKGRVKGEVTVTSLFKVDLTGEHSRTWIFARQYQSFLAAQKMSTDDLTMEQLEAHQLRLKKIPSLIKKLVPEDKLSVDETEALSEEKLLEKEHQLLDEVEKYGSLCKQLDLDVHLKKHDHIKKLRREKRDMEAQWGIVGTVEGRHDYLQRTLLAFCYFDQKLSSCAQHGQAKEYADKMEQLVTYPPMLTDHDRLHEATCLVIEVPFGTSSWTGILSGRIGGSMGIGSYLNAQGSIKGEIVIEHTARRHPSRMREGRYLDMTFSLGVDIVPFTALSIPFERVLTGAGLTGTVLDSALSELNGMADGQLNAGLTGKVQIRFFSPTQRYAAQEDASEEHPFKLLYIRVFSELSQKSSVSIDVPVIGAPSVLAGAEFRSENAVSNVLKEYIGADTLCYLATQHHGRVIARSDYLPAWNCFLDMHATQLGKLFSNFANPQSQAHHEARFMVSQGNVKTTEGHGSNLENEFFSAMQAYHDGVNSEIPASKESLKITFDQARDQLTALFKNDQPYWSKERKTTWIYRT